VGLGQTLLLGFIAGVTILIGMPLGRMRRPSEALRVTLNALAVGILLFLVWDVLSGAWEPIDEGLAAHHETGAGLGSTLGYGVLFALGLTVGLMGLQQYEAWMGRRVRRARQSTGPGTMASHELTTRGISGWSPAKQLALLIAVGIGLHNFAEGLAIGVSAKAGEIGLATVLIIGFALHNATEGFGIVGPLGGVRPSWRWLGLAGLVAGGPTFLGSMVGYQVTSGALELLFFALAGGAILYVIGEIWNGVRRYGHLEFGLYLLGIGFLLGVATDLVVAYGGG